MMSEPETKIEIEDVLSSIRRLVSRDTVVLRTAPVPHRDPAPQPEAGECLVLTPALRIGESDMGAPEKSPLVAEAVAAAFETESVLTLLPQISAAPVAEAEVAAQADVEPELEAEVAGELQASIVTPEDAPLSEEAASFVEEPDLAPPMAAVEDTAPLLLRPEEAVLVPEAAPMAEVIPAAAPPRPMTEAEVLLAQAEAALAESGMVLDDATTAIDAAGESDATDAFGVEAVTVDSAPSIDLGDELSRLESTIAELEAAVAESGLDFEPETGHPFSADEAAPLSALPDSFEEEAPGALGPCNDPTVNELVEIASQEPELTAVEDALEDAAQAEAYAQQDFAAAAHAAFLDPEMQEAALGDEAGADAEWAEVTGGSQARAAELQAASDEAGVGMDWAEATLNLARRTPPRRLAVSDAEQTLQTAGGLRSSYEELRAELAQDAAEVDDLLAEDLSLIDAGIFDETMLRDMVAQMVREELRGSLGERITQNVRKLVRREIQRALMGQDYE